MSTDEHRRGANDEPQDEVEAHHHGPHKLANDEGGDEVEAHHHGPHKLANDEGDDDVEAHRVRANHPKKV